MNLDFEDYLNRKVDLKELLNSIDFTEEEVEHAAMAQPKLFLRAARFHVQKMRERVEAELAYENANAKLSSRYQDRKDEKGKRKLTEGAVKAKVQLDHKIRSLRRRMEMSHLYEKLSALLLRSYEKREFAIKVILDARFAEGGKLIKMMKKKDGKRMAEKLAKDIRSRYNHTTGSEISDD